MASAVAQTYVVTNAGNNYVISGLMGSNLTLQRGSRYVFQINATGHPMYIQTTGGSYNVATVYSSGVSGNGTQVGTLTFDVPESAPDTLYYQCQYHPNMFGVIYIIDTPSQQSFVDIDPASPTVEDLVDKIFYGLKQNRLTGKASIDTIIGDDPIRLPDKYSTRTDDYVNWMWSYNRFVYSYEATTGRLLMEVL